MSWPPVHKLLVHRRLKDIEEQLSAPFARIHNSYIVNVALLESIRDNQVFVGGRQIPISEKFREGVYEPDRGAGVLDLLIGPLPFIPFTSVAFAV